MALYILLPVPHDSPAYNFPPFSLFQLLFSDTVIGLSIFKSVEKR